MRGQRGEGGAGVVPRYLGGGTLPALVVFTGSGEDKKSKKQHWRPGDGREQENVFPRLLLQFNLSQ